MFVRESLCRTHIRIRGPKFVLYEGNFKKGLGQWGRSIGPGPRAHMSLGISVPYISPPPWFIPGCREESRSWPSLSISEVFGPGTRGYGFPLMLISKDVPFRDVRYSCHYCLTVCEPKRRAYRLALVFAGPFVNRAHLLPDWTFLSPPFWSHK